MGDVIKDVLFRLDLLQVLTQSNTRKIEIFHLEILNVSDRNKKTVN